MVVVMGGSYTDRKTLMYLPGYLQAQLKMNVLMGELMDESLTFATVMLPKLRAWVDEFADHWRG